MSAVRITVTGGRYEGASFEGALSAAPVTILVPEGIVSARTTDEAATVRDRIAALLATHDRVVLSSTRWQITAERATAAA